MVDIQTASIVIASASVVAGVIYWHPRFKVYLFRFKTFDRSRHSAFIYSVADCVQTPPEE